MPPVNIASNVGTAPATIVSRFEFSLLRILRGLLGLIPPEHYVSHIYHRSPAPSCLSAACVRIASELFRKGMVHHLIHAGGWEKATFLRGNRAINGRVWERIPLHERSFHLSRYVLDFLLWITSEKPTESKTLWKAPIEELTIADKLFFAITLDTLQGMSDLTGVLATLSSFRDNSFCWLLSPFESSAITSTSAPSFEDLFRDVLGTVVLECWQPLLVKRWFKNDRAFPLISDWEQARVRGQAATITLTNYLSTAESHRRRDLARFVLDSVVQVFQRDPRTVHHWVAGLPVQSTLRLAERIEIQRGMLALPRQLLTMERWAHQARTVPFYDEEYPISQFWLEEWDHYQGYSLANLVRSIESQLEPIRVN